MHVKDERVRGIIRHLAAEFLAREANRTSLLTVTDVKISDQGNKAVILFTVFPADKHVAALGFVKRSRSEFREFVKEKSRLGRIPSFDFEIDVGEMNRQKIEDIINADNNKSQ